MAAAGNRVTRLTVRGRFFAAFAVALVAAAYVFGSSLLLLFGCLLAVLLGIALVLTHFRTLPMSAVRSFAPHIVAAGNATVVTLAVANQSRSRSASAHWRDTVPWSPGATPAAMLPPLAPRTERFASTASSTRLNYRLTPQRRGIYEIGPLMVDYTDPFGLAAVAVRLAGRQELTVTPAVVPLPDRVLSMDAGDGAAKVVHRSVHGDDDDHMTREYRSGDALRRVHWRASARHGGLMVRQEDHRSDPDVRLVFDTWRSGYPDAVTPTEVSDAAAGRPARNASAHGASPDSDYFEWVVRMVASLGVHLHDAGFRVHILESANAEGPPVGDASDWSGQSDRFLSGLAGIQLVPVQHSSTTRYARRAVAPPTAPPTAQSTAQATVQSTAPRRAAEGQNGPVFAILAHPAEETVDWVLHQRRPGEPAVAIVLAGVAQRTVDAIGAAGWHCVVAQATDDPAAVWASVADSQGSANVSR